MRTRRRVLLVALVVLVVAAGAVVFALRARGGGPPQLLVRALEVMPPAAGTTGLYFTTQQGTLESVYGFAPGRVEPSVEQAYGIRGENVTAVLESGGPSSTVLLGTFPVDEAAASLEALGYGSTAANGWLQLVAGDQAQGPLAAGAEAVALRGDVIVIGAADQIDAVVRGEANRHFDDVLDTVPAQAEVVTFGPSYDEMVGDKVAPPAPNGGQQRYRWWLLALWGEGDERQGVVAQRYDGATAAAAGELAGRIAAAPPTGMGAEPLVLDPGQPRWDAASGVATVPITAAGSPHTWAQLRDLLERGEAGFLRQP